ncbi:MAG: GWxTD domain-containing protein [Thermoanaerobaculia bacterium]
MRRWSLILALLSAVAATPVAAVKAAPPPEEISNFLLSPSYSRWLVGPVYFLASEDEARRFLGLSDDTAAQGFIERFWERRDPNAERPGNAVRELFERRREQADTLFDQPPVLGHQTDRGVVFVFFGEPDETRIETSADVDAPPQEVWTYRQAPPGLNERPGRTRYAFTLRSDGSIELTHGLH